jgi:hypothetical protein
MPESALMPAWDEIMHASPGRRAMLCLQCVTTEQIIAAIDAEIARLQLARALIAPSVTPTAPDQFATAISNLGKRKARKLSAEARERIAAAQRKRWAEQKKTAAITVTRVPAREAPKRRAPKPDVKPETPLTAKIPDGPVAAPAKS